MKKLLLLIIFAGLFHVQLSAQKYYHFQTNGELPAGYDINKVNDSNNVKKLLSANTNDRLSAIRSFPFPFKFNGKYYVNYKVSDNGYLTFNTSETTSYLPDSAFTTRQNLKNCIVPFWYDFELKKLPFPNQDFNVKIYAYTSGRYPSRTHVIQYYGISKSSDTLSAIITNANVFAFAIVLHEGDEGRFDLIYNYFGKNNIKGLAGCSNASGAFSLIKDTSLYYPVAASSALQNTIVYQFYPGTEPSKKLYIKDNNVKHQYPVGYPVIIESRISNLGADTVFKFNYSYSVDGKDTLTEIMDLRKTGKPLLPKGENTLLITALQPWTKGAAGSISAIRTMAHFDTDSLNKDTLRNSRVSNILRILGVKPIERNTMLEISTGGWCGYCTSSHLIAENMKKQMGHTLIPVMHHFGDPMQTTESNLVNEAYQKGYPYGVIDRKYFSGSSPGWFNIINIEKKDSSNIKVKLINRHYDETTRKITFTVNVRCFDYLSGNYRIGAMVTEDYVRGNASPSQWSQNNFNSKQYGATDSTTPLYHERRYMDGYFHHYVVLDIPSGAWGKDSSLPGFMKPNDEFNVDFSYTLPPTTKVDYTVENNTPFCSTRDDDGHNEGMFKPLDINLIGFVAEYDADIYKRTLLNAVSNKLLFDNTSVRTIRTSGELMVFPNPANQSVSFINPFSISRSCHITLCNAEGKQIFSGRVEETNQRFNIDISGMNNGIYFLKASADGVYYYQKIMVARGE